MRVAKDNFHKDIKKKHIGVSIQKKLPTIININTSKIILILLSCITFILGLCIGINASNKKADTYSSTHNAIKSEIALKKEDNGLIKEQNLPNLTANSHPHVDSSNDELGVLIENYYLKLPADIQSIAENEDWKIIVDENMTSYSNVVNENGKTTIYIQDSLVAAEKLLHEVGFLLWDKDDTQDVFIEIANDELIPFTTTFKTSKSELLSANAFYGESFYRYIQNPSVLSVKCPRLYNYWNAKYGKEN